MKIEDPNLEPEQIFLNLPCSLWWMDREHNYIGCNIETCAAFKAHSPDEILGKNVIDIATTKDLSEFKAKAIYDQDEHIMTTGIPEFQIKNMIPPYIRENPSWQLGAKKPIFNARNETIGLMGVTLFDHNIGEEFKTSLKDININQFKTPNHPTIHLSFKDALHLMPCSIWWLDREHFYLGGNLECCELCEVNSPQELIGKDIHKVAEIKELSDFKAKNIYDLDEFIMQTGIPEFNIENIVSRRNQSSIRQFGSKKAIFNIHNEVIGLIGVGIDGGQFGIPNK